MAVTAKTLPTTDEPQLATMLNKVPQITLYFWIIKVLATTVGETAADLLATRLNLGLTITSFVMSALFVAALVWQMRMQLYVPAPYWLTVVLISVVGTLISDNLVDGLGISLVTTSIAFAIGSPQSLQPGMRARRRCPSTPSS